MYLKNIEVQGFKSFANRIRFEFHNGITGIVGPNGSGKSNVADAVRWVLGEQSAKQLRGANMQDVIFSGTETRKAQSYASVAITLDNGDRQLNIDYDEVTVARRVYRSGESEYLINGTACRLRDVNELFYDTGIGKEGYSIIGQGQIDKILSGKPEERRELFDEAAGIVKFKRRKAVTLKKLEEEQSNLVRVKDILSELEKQVGPLERQSETARKYLQMREELKSYDISLFLAEKKQAEEQIEELLGKREIVSGQMEETRNASEELRRQYAALEERLEELNRNIESARNELQEAKVEKSQTEGQINVLCEQINTERMNREHIAGRRKTVQSQLDAGKAEEEELLKKKKETAARCLEGEQAVRKAQEELEEQEREIRGLEEAISEEKGTIIQLLNEKSGIAARGQRYETMLEQAMVRRAEVGQKLIRSKAEEETVQAEEEACQKEAAELEELQRAVRKQEEGLQKELQEKNLRYHQAAKYLNEAQREYHVLKSRVESLKNIAERYEGYGNSIRRVMETRDRVSGIHGVVADLIQVERAYELAVETALGGSIQNIVTDSEQTAKHLIEYLKKNKFGRATFLPLDGIQNRGKLKEPGVLKEPGIVGLACDLVKADPVYQDLIQYLLGRVVVADTIDHALALARKYRYTLRIVTLDGELLNAGGSMTGGAFKNSSNLLGRKREIEELEGKAQKVLENYERLLKEQTALEQEIEAGKREQEDLQKKFQEAALKANTAQMKQRQAKSRAESVREGREDAAREMRQLEEQLKEIRAQKEAVRSEMEAVEGRNSDAEASVETKSQSLEAARGRREKQAEALTKLKMDSANLSQQAAFIRENLERMKRERENLFQEQASLEAGEAQGKEAVRQKEAEIEEKRSLIQKAGRKIQQAEERAQAFAAERDGHMARQKEYFAGREELSGRMSSLEKEAFRLDGQKEKLEEHLDSQVNYLWEQYEMMPSEAAQAGILREGALPELRRRAGELKAGIRNLGSVNVNAIEDYREVSERFEFMKRQYEDLTEAEASLRQIIEELDTGMRTQFAEKFQEIRAEFNRVFRELFGGGKGELELTEEEDVIEAGIRIISQPPGKKLQNMMQLSGGEKALTAIALLFAIQNLKPSPFCLLDEIEAALDDSNVGRFAQYLHKLTKNTQFIVITHRRGTMVAADRLYGITMQEKGVSTLVSVNLIDKELSA